MIMFEWVWSGHMQTISYKLILVLFLSLYFDRLRTQLVLNLFAMMVSWIYPSCLVCDLFLVFQLLNYVAQRYYHLILGENSE